MNLSALYAEFPNEAVSWRAQSVTKDGSKAMALAYIDARDVMRRLDEAVGPENWQDSYVETPKGRVICTISIRLNGEWVGKSDGSGDTDVEGEKGGISGAFKRAAVKWGVGRYLYDMPNVWVPCECSDYNGKKQWRSWKADPWQYVRNAPKGGMPEPAPEPSAPQASSAPNQREAEAQAFAAAVSDALRRIAGADTLSALGSLWGELNETARAVAADPRVIKAKDDRKTELHRANIVQAEKDSHKKGAAA